jgi:hypothetical protein
VSTLYNIVFGVNPCADELLALLGLTRAECGRFRDCYVQRGAGELLLVHVLTRNGAGNRSNPALAEANRRLRRCPYYVIEWDEDFDGTYATFVFNVLARPKLEALVSRDPRALPEPFGVRLPAFLKRMREGIDDPEVNRVAKAIRPSLEKIQRIFEHGGKVAGLLDSDSGECGPNVVKLGE